MAHNTQKRNEEFRAAWDETNARYIACAEWAISETFKHRNDSKHVRQACRDNIAFYRKHFHNVRVSK